MLPDNIKFTAIAVIAFFANLAHNDAGSNQQSLMIIVCLIAVWSKTPSINYIAYVGCYSIIVAINQTGFIVTTWGFIFMLYVADYVLDEDFWSNSDMSLRDRMKMYETEYDQRIPKNKPFIVRLNGRTFSKWTKKLPSRSDPNFQKTMVLTMNDLISEFKPATGYTHSDDITLIFPECSIFKRRVQKIITVMAGYCSARFNYHIQEIPKSMYSESVQNVIQKGIFHFDARVICPNKSYEILNHQIWRSVHECYSIAVQWSAREFYTNNELYKKTTNNMIEMIALKNITFDDFPEHILYGTYAKRENYVKEIQHDDCIESVIRTRVANKTWKMLNEPGALEELLAPKWTDWSDHLNTYST